MAMKRLALLFTLVALLSGCVATKTKPDFRDKYPYLLKNPYLHHTFFFQHRHRSH